MNEVDLLSDDWPDSGQQPPIRPPNERHVDIKPVNNGEINEEDLLVKVASSTTSQSTSKTMQHDLEKLQEAHDKLMHEIEEKRLFIVKMHEQLDRVVEENNNLKLEMEEKENDLRSVASKLTSQESLRKELTETQDKMNKLKQLASKYKKELLESKEEGERRKASAAQEVKDATRDLQKEVDKVNAVYQQSVRNFQNLQVDFDKLQDEFDSLKEEKKRTEADLNQSLSELNRIRVEIAEAKHDNETLLKKITNLDKESEIQLNRRKELESKIIVLENELSLEKKKVQTNAGLEKHLQEMRVQLNQKTSQVAELDDLKERFKEVSEESVKLKSHLMELTDQIKKLSSDNEILKEDNWNLNRKTESLNSLLEAERVKVIELLEENQSLKSREDKVKNVNRSLQSETEAKLKFLRSQLITAEESLAFKDKEFESYKRKVTQVLNEKQQESTEVIDLRNRIEEIESARNQLQEENERQQKQLDQITFEKKQLELKSTSIVSEMNEKVSQHKTEIDTLEKEIETIKSLNRDLQSKVISQKSFHDMTIKMAEEREQSEIKLHAEIVSLNEKIKELQDSLNAIKSVTPTTESKTVTDHDDHQEHASSPADSVDDVESLLSTSLTPTTKHNHSSSTSENDPVTHEQSLESTQGLILDQILNSKDGYIDPRRVQEMEVSLERLTLSLQETEHNNSLLSEQNHLLKEEIRRLERSIDRMDTAKNMEYLKNLVIKYLSLPEGSSEKLLLVPVFTTLLKLDKREESFFSSHANGDSPAAAAGQGSSQGSWSSMLWGS